MVVLTLLKAGIKRQKGSVVGLFLLMLAMTVTFVTALTVLHNSGRYIREEMQVLGYGDLTAWVSQTEDMEGLISEIDSLPEVERVAAQPVIFSGYTIHEKHSDDEGQLIAYDPADFPYKILNSELMGYQNHAAEVFTIEPGTIYLSPAMQSSFQAKIGDEVHFRLSRDGAEKSFIVAGYFEDPFMGSSMIDMKSFLISQSDFDLLSTALQETSDFNVLGRTGAMLHIDRIDNKEIGGAEQTAMQFSQYLHEHTSLANNTEFVYTDTTIYGFMMILQNVLTGFLLSFTILFAVVTLIVAGHSISNAMEQEYQDIGILKTMGCTSKKLQTVQLMQYLSGLVLGMLAGVLVSIYTVRLTAKYTITSTGMLMPVKLPLFWCIGGLLLILCFYTLFIGIQLKKVINVSPLRAISGKSLGRSLKKQKTVVISAKRLDFTLALRQLLYRKKSYMGTFLIAVLLVFLASVVGRMNGWLGLNGEGLMDAFSVAEHDLGVQPKHSMDMEEMEAVIASYAEIEEIYELAMQSVNINGADYTANVLDEVSYFHVMQGKTCSMKNEILLTEFAAADLGVGIGDTVSVSRENKTADYTVSGIYECANEMGANIGMSRQGYARIADVEDYIWCKHYLLSDSSWNEEIMQTLQSRYPLDADVHTNSWSGLDGIVHTMQLLTIFMYGVIGMVILVVIALNSSKQVQFEQQDMAVFKSIGFTSGRLRGMFMIRTGAAAALGAAIGELFSILFADRMITVLLKSFGISRFASDIAILSGVVTPVLILVLFMLAAYLFSGRLKRVDIAVLVKQGSD